MMLRRNLWDPSTIDGHGTEGGAAPDGGILLPDHGAFHRRRCSGRYSKRLVRRCDRRRLRRRHAPVRRYDDGLPAALGPRRLRRRKTMRESRRKPGPAGLDWRITPDFDDDPGWVPGVVTQPPADGPPPRPTTASAADYVAARRSGNLRRSSPGARGPRLADHARFRRRSGLGSGRHHAAAGRYDLPHDRRRHRAAGYVVASRSGNRSGSECGAPPSTGRLRPIDPGWVPGTILPPATTDDDDLRPDTDAVEDSDFPSGYRTDAPQAASQDVERALTYDEVSAQYPGIVWPVNWWLL